jgi:hypothetical protein
VRPTEPGSQLPGGDPRQQQEAGVVHQQVEALAARRGAPPDEAIARGGLPRRSAAAEQAQQAPLGLVARRLATHWHARQGYGPALLETFVQKPRFAGTCCKAASWQHVGDTQGRAKLDTAHEHAVPVKSIWVLPLSQRFRQTLTAWPLRRARLPQDLSGPWRALVPCRRRSAPRAYGRSQAQWCHPMCSVCAWLLALRSPFDGTYCESQTNRRTRHPGAPVGTSAAA